MPMPFSTATPINPSRIFNDPPSPWPFPHLVGALVSGKVAAARAGVKEPLALVPVVLVPARM